MFIHICGGSYKEFGKCPPQFGGFGHTLMTLDRNLQIVVACAWRWLWKLQTWFLYVFVFSNPESRHDRNAWKNGHKKIPTRSFCTKTGRVTISSILPMFVATWLESKRRLCKARREVEHHLDLTGLINQGAFSGWVFLDGENDEDVYLYML